MARAATPQRKWISTIFAWVVALLIFFPILWTILTSFKTEGDAILFPPAFLPPHWTLENYFEVQSRSDYFGHFYNSVVIAVGSTVLALLVAVPGAWSMAFSPTKRTKDILMWMLSTKMMPAVGVLVPIYLIFKNLGLLDSLSGLTVVLALIDLPIVIWMLYTYFKEIPVDILEAARMDGAVLVEGDRLCALADGGSRHRIDHAPEHHPRLERGVLDTEPDSGQSRSAHRLHRLLFSP